MMVMVVNVILVLLELSVTFIVVLADLLENGCVIFEELVNLVVSCVINLYFDAAIYTPVYLFLLLFGKDWF